MWLRMVNKFPRYCDMTMPKATGKTCEEWIEILNQSIEKKCGIIAVVEYLTTEYQLKPDWAQMIALQYVLGTEKAHTLN